MSIGASAAEKPASLGWRRTASTAVVVGAAAIVVAALLEIAATDQLGWDFRYGYLRAAELVLEGQSPYPALDEATLSGDKTYVYPPQLAVVLAPLTVLPEDLVVWLAFAGALAAVVGALAVLGVRDVRCYAVVLLWGSTASALQLVNLSVFLALALALAWRFRASVWPLATILGLAISTKLFLWPLGAWALATGRARAAVRAVLLGTGVTFVAWAVIGFAGLTAYPELVTRFSHFEGERNSYSIVAVVVSLGYDSLVGEVLALLVGGAMLVACVHFAMRARDDERSFAAAIGAALAFMPVVWLHYFVVLAIPLAMARPRFSALWLVPILLWVCPRVGNGDGLQPLVPTAVVAVLLGALLLRPSSRAETAEVPA